MGKNSHVGNLAAKVVEMYFLSQDPNAVFTVGKKGADIEVTMNGNTERYEIKGTIDANISWTKLKVSSQDCYDYLVNGMTLIRVTGVGGTHLRLYFMKYGVDFTLVPETRYAVKSIGKPTKAN